MEMSNQHDERRWNLPLKRTLSRHWFGFQRELFPWLEEALGPLGERYQRLVRVLELVRVEELLPYGRGWRGRPLEDRAALARGFLAKAVLDLATTRALVERLRVEPTLRRLCGWEGLGRSRARRPSHVPLGSLLTATCRGVCMRRCWTERWRVTWRATCRGTRPPLSDGSRRAPKAAAVPRPKRRLGRPRKGEQRPKQLSRIERQASMTLEQMLEELPQACDIGVKPTGKGHQESWTGYKLHIDAIDGGIPVSCLLTSASVHDSQAAIPLATLTSRRVDSLYDLMDSAYDTSEIRAFSEKLGHVPIIDVNPRRRAEIQAQRKREALAQRCIGHVSAQARRFRERSTVERVNGRLKEEFGGRHVRVGGPDKVMCHLMFGILALTVEQLMRLTL